MATTFTLRSDALDDGGVLPAAQRGAATGAGARDESPPLSWSGAPAGTRSYAVTVFDPDAPGPGGFWHWAVLDIPADVTSLPAGAGSRDGRSLPSGAFQLRNDGGSVGYLGAAPPKGHGPHHYIITVHALNVEKSGLDAGASPAAFEARLRPHVLARASLTGVYERR
ncbi:YbhB/YbcL family Raf kinase inhibitor-like protein [Arthrobacter sp. B3I4]|uniref:YbhB/YbcL family Raf kinase inhibitor-like protein n=1 Tax=Arthrobacter sp. B3I4 TaxID=3042267 RepID=UPI002781E59C|nr:YbhB/YbcL family Raf kinase inhibitor-like protein [Arthrobacter sp. B3I4]MDQ0754672.1 Raf kinase inhibitor-like YbhB/YbcL family protein [Arthrobacter sp. B3I4]